MADDFWDNPDWAKDIFGDRLPNLTRDYGPEEDDGYPKKDEEPYDEQPVTAEAVLVVAELIQKIRGTQGRPIDRTLEMQATAIAQSINAIADDNVTSMSTEKLRNLVEYSYDYSIQSTDNQPHRMKTSDLIESIARSGGISHVGSGGVQYNPELAAEDMIEGMRNDIQGQLDGMYSKDVTISNEAWAKAKKLALRAFDNEMAYGNPEAVAYAMRAAVDQVMSNDDGGERWTRHDKETFAALDLNEVPSAEDWTPWVSQQEFALNNLGPEQQAIISADTSFSGNDPEQWMQVQGSVQAARENDPALFGPTMAAGDKLYAPQGYVQWDQATHYMNSRVSSASARTLGMALGQAGLIGEGQQFRQPGVDPSALGSNLLLAPDDQGSRQIAEENLYLYRDDLPSGLTEHARSQMGPWADGLEYKARETSPYSEALFGTTRPGERTEITGVVTDFWTMSQEERMFWQSQLVDMGYLDSTSVIWGARDDDTLNALIEMLLDGEQEADVPFEDFVSMRVDAETSRIRSQIAAKGESLQNPERYWDPLDQESANLQSEFFLANMLGYSAPEHLVNQGAGMLMGWDADNMANSPTYRQYLFDLEQHGISEDQIDQMLQALNGQEGFGNPNFMGEDYLGSGHFGPYQFDKATFDMAKVQAGMPNADFTNVEHHHKVARGRVGFLLEKYNYDTRSVFAAWYAGEVGSEDNDWRTYGGDKTILDYVNETDAIYQSLGGAGGGGGLSQAAPQWVMANQLTREEQENRLRDWAGSTDEAKTARARDLVGGTIFGGLDKGLHGRNF